MVIECRVSITSTGGSERACLRVGDVEVFGDYIPHLAPAHRAILAEIMEAHAKELQGMAKRIAR